MKENKEAVFAFWGQLCAAAKGNPQRRVDRATIDGFGTAAAGHLRILSALRLVFAVRDGQRVIAYRIEHYSPLEANVIISAHFTKKAQAAVARENLHRIAATSVNEERDRELHALRRYKHNRELADADAAHSRPDYSSQAIVLVDGPNVTILNHGDARHIGYDGINWSALLGRVCIWKGQPLALPAGEGSSRRDNRLKRL